MNPIPTTPAGASSLSTPAVGFPFGKVLLSAGALFPAVGAFLADWNATHLFNPKWTPHAKFHDAQTITLAAEAAGLSLWYLWGPGSKTGSPGLSRLRSATLFGGLFFLTLPPAILFPGVKLVDEDNPHRPTTFAGLPVNQVTGIAAILLPLLAVGYALEKRRLRRLAPASQAA